MKYLLALAILIATAIGHAAEVIPIKPIQDCFGCSSSPSMTMYWQGKASKAVLILIPGGDGAVGFKPDQTTTRKEQFLYLSRLTDPNLTRGQFDFVALDSPFPLSPNQPYPSARGGAEHMIRIESAIRYYKEKTGLPVWIMGHSNGGISLTEFVKYAQKNGKLDLISGMIASEIRSESYFNAPINFPVLFMNHQNGACGSCNSTSAHKQFENMKQFNTQSTEYVYITTGSAEFGNPCTTGFHMYHNAGAEVAKVIDDFMSSVYQ